MTLISLIDDGTEFTGRAQQRAQHLYALSGLLMLAGSALITLAALIAWWPLSPVILVVAAALFWTLVAVTAEADPADVQLA